MSEPRPSHLVFSCGKSWYALPADRAAEVVSLPDLTRVPGAPAHLLGVFAHRGEVIPVIDLPRLLDRPPVDTQRAVLLRLPQRGALALLATKVAGVSVVSGVLEPLGSAGVLAHLRGPGQTGHGEVAVIEPEGLFDFLSQGG